MSSQAYWFDSAPWTTYGEFNPTPVFTSTDSGHTVTQIIPSQSIRFASNSSSVGIYSYFSTAAGRTYVLNQRPVGGSNTSWTQVGSAVIPATGSGAYQVFNMATGLDTSSNYEYEILLITPILLSGNQGSWYDGYVELDTGTLATVSHPKRFVWGMYGDSITGMTSAHQTDIASPIITDTRYGDMWLATNFVNRAMVIAASPGGKVNPTLRDATAGIPANVDGVRVNAGRNDMPDLGSAIPNSAYQTAFGVMVDNIRAQIGAGKLIACYKPFAALPTDDTNRDLCGTLIQAAIVGKANVIYVNTDGWFIPDAASNMPNSPHPNALGYAQLAPNEYGPLGGTGNMTATTLTATTAHIGP